MLQARNLLRRVILKLLQFLRLPLDLRDQLLEARFVTLNGFYFLAALFGEVAVVRQRSAEARGIALVQQQFEFFLAANHVCRPHLARKRGAFGLQRIEVAALFGA